MEYERDLVKDGLVAESWGRMTYKKFAGILLVAIVALGAASCDKCGHTVKFLAPSLPKACGDNADPSRG